MVTEAEKFTIFFRFHWKNLCLVCSSTVTDKKKTG